MCHQVYSYQKLNPINKKLEELNKQIRFDKKLNDFIAEKILETYTDKEIEDVLKYREINNFIAYEKTINELNEPYIDDLNYYHSYVSSTIFDPLYDSWEIYDYEKNGDDVRLIVTCLKNEKSISGIMRFTDEHKTSWFKLNENYK